jgi:hypothetical protein
VRFTGFVPERCAFWENGVGNLMPRINTMHLDVLSRRHIVKLKMGSMQGLAELGLGGWRANNDDSGFPARQATVVPAAAS